MWKDAGNKITISHILKAKHATLHLKRSQWVPHFDTFSRQGFQHSITFWVIQSSFSAMSAGKNRLGPDPSVSISDIQKKIWETTQRQGCTDLLKLLYSKQPMSWKSAPCGKWLGTDPMCDLFCSLFSVHVNGVMAAKKLKKALLSLQAEKGRLNFSKYHDSDWSDKVDEQLRIAAQKYREIKKDSQKYGRCIKKCSCKEKENIDKVLDFLTIPEAEVVGPSKKMLVQPEEEDQFILKGMAASDEEPLKLTVFSRVLKKEASDPSSPNFQRKPKVEMSGSMSSRFQPSKASKPGLAVVPPGSLECDEAGELKSWMAQEATVGPKKKGGKKPKGKGCKKPKVLKKPAAVVTKEKKQVAYKTSFLHRVTSAAWNKAKKEALRKGKTMDQARLAGRKASAEVAEKVKRGQLKEA